MNTSLSVATDWMLLPPPPPKLMLKPNPRCDGIWRERLWEVGVRSLGGKPWWMGSVLFSDRQAPETTRPLHHESRGQEPSPQSTRKSAPTRPRNPSVPRSWPSPPQSWVNLECLLFKPLALGYFVRAAWRAETNVYSKSDAIKLLQINTYRFIINAKYV